MDSLRGNPHSLLVLNKSDVTATKASRSSPVPRKTRKLLLLQLPTSSSTSSAMAVADLRGAFFLADGKQSSLIHQNSSYKMSTVGTSNALVLIPPLTASSRPPSTKRFRHSHRIRLCELIGNHPGKSVATFLELTEQSKLEKDDLMSFFSTSRSCSLADMVVALHRSKREIQEALKANMLVIGHDVETPKEKYELIDEEVVLDAQSAILAALCEVMSDHAVTGFIAPVSDAASHVESRMEPGTPHAYLVARRMLEEIRLPNTSGGEQRMYIDTEQISIWVARKLFLQKEVWTNDRLLATWESHLPGVVGDCNDVYKAPTVDLLEGIAQSEDGGTTWVRR